MSRSIHSTRNEFRRELLYRYADGASRRERLTVIHKEIQKKRRIKSRVRTERAIPPPADLPLAPPDAIRIDIVERGGWIHYPASPADLQGVMERLPSGVLTGLSGIRLCLGSDFQEEELTAEERAAATRDPWLGRVGYENLPGVFGGRYLGTYWSPPARIDLYAYVRDSALPERVMWEFFLRLRMLATFVHEVAHHEDYTQRVARGRWRADDTGKAEAFAEATAARWVQQCVVPYLEETYPGAVQDLNAWVQYYGGTDIPLWLLAGEWRWDSEGKMVSLQYGSASDGFEELVRDIQRGESLTASRLNFARTLHYGENYAEALRIIDRILGEDPANLEALTLQATISECMGDYRRAEALARHVIHLDEKYVGAWLVLSDVHAAQEDWRSLLDAAAQGVAAGKDSDLEWHFLLRHRARANLELGHYANLAAELETWSEMPGGTRRAAPLRALLLLRIGQYEEAFRLAESQIASKRILDREVFVAARFEAAQRLGRPAEGGELTVDVLQHLRRLNYNGWVDRLVAEYGLRSV